MLDLFGAAAFETVVLAIDLGVFEAPDDGALPVEDLAARVDADPDGLRTLPRFLAAEGYVAAEGDTYRNRR